MVVSPSMSGRFSLDVLLRSPGLMCGFVPVAPVTADRVSPSAYAAVTVPTLVIYGDKDTGLGRTAAKHLQQIPTASKPQVRKFCCCMARLLYCCNASTVTFATVASDVAAAATIFAVATSFAVVVVAIYFAASVAICFATAIFLLLLLLLLSLLPIISSMMMLLLLLWLLVLVLPTKSNFLYCLQIIPNARHPAYLDNPKMFNTLLYNFIKKLSC